jgi:hypothetical protein
VEWLVVDSATLYIENDQKAYPFTEYLPCHEIPETSNIFSSAAPRSHLCLADEFASIISSWNTDSSGEKGISNGVIIGIVVGGVVLIVATGIVGFVFGRKCCTPKKEEPASGISPVPLYVSNSWV